MNKLYLPVLLLATLFSCRAADASCGAAPYPAANVEDILGQNLRAVRTGLADDWPRNMDNIIQIDEGGHTLLARYRATADGHMRIDVFSEDERVYSEGKDEHGVWEWPGGTEKPENVYHDGVGALEHGIEFNLFALAELPARGHDIELVECESLYGNDYYVLKVTLSDSFENFRYVNAETWLVDLSRDFRAFHPGIDATKKHLESRYDEWATVDGVRTSRRTRNVDLDSGEVLATTRVLSVQYNGAREALDLSRSYVPSGAPLVDE